MPDLNWPSEGPSGSPGFDTGFHTDWFAIRTAGRRVPESAEALEKICRTYWYPLYAYVRRKGYSPHEAQDLTQEFFARLLTTSWLEEVHPSKGRFRSFLLASMNHFLAKEWRREQTQKRGGGHATFSLDAVEAEKRYLVEPAHDQSPDRVYERGWAGTLLERVFTQMRGECVAEDKADLFSELVTRLDGENNSTGYGEIAARLGMSVDAVKKAAQRLRKRFQELVRVEVAATVTDPAEVDEEMRSLFAALGS